MTEGVSGEVTMSVSGGYLTTRLSYRFFSLTFTIALSISPLLQPISLYISLCLSPSVSLSSNSLSIYYISLSLSLCVSLSLWPDLFLCLSFSTFFLLRFSLDHSQTIDYEYKIIVFISAPTESQSPK